MRPQEISGLSRSRSLALLSPRRRRSAAAGIGFSLALALVLSSCEGSPTSSGGEPPVLAVGAAAGTQGPRLGTPRSALASRSREPSLEAIRRAPAPITTT